MPAFSLRLSRAFLVAATLLAVGCAAPAEEEAGTATGAAERLTLTRSEVSSRVFRIVSEQLGVSLAEVTEDKSFVADLGADELDTVELVMAVEDDFGIRIPDAQAERFTTARHVIDYVVAHQ